MTGTVPAPGSRIDRIEGTAIALPGDDIDTDRIMPARFLRAVTFDGLEAHLFEDDREQAAREGVVHPFANPASRGASILLVNGNFGCGSSREHAPQGLLRWGIRALIGESFADIFFGNAVAMGMPCVAAEHGALEYLMAQASAGVRLAIDLTALTVGTPERTLPVALSAPAREAFLRGTWDPVALLVERFDEVREVAGRLPYVRGFE